MATSALLTAVDTVRTVPYWEPYVCTGRRRWSTTSARLGVAYKLSAEAWKAHQTAEAQRLRGAGRQRRRQQQRRRCDAAADAGRREKTSGAATGSRGKPDMGRGEREKRPHGMGQARRSAAAAPTYDASGKHCSPSPLLPSARGQRPQLTPFMTGTPVLPLLKVVFESILEVFLMCLAGYILATQGILDRKTQKQLNRLNVSLFTPSLLFSKVAFFLSPAKLRELWIIPIFFVFTTGVSMVVAYVFGWLLRLKKSQRSFAVAASMFMNSNSLPIALMQSLVVTVPNLKWGDDDNVNAMVGRALTYLVLYSTLGMVLRWSYGVRLLSSADPDTVEELPASPLVERDETAFPNSTGEDRILRHEPSSLTDVDDTKTLTHPPTTTDDPKSLPSSRSFSPEPQPQASTSGAPSVYAHDYSDGDSEDDSELPMGRPIPEPTSSLWQSRMRRTRNRIRSAWRTLYDFMTVPLWAALASLLVACVRPLQHILEMHIQPVKGALNAAGNCSIPLTLVVLGAYFYSPPEDARALPAHKTLSRSPSWASRSTLYSQVRGMFSLRRREADAEEEVRPPTRRQARPGETKTVAVAVLSRMVITPLLLLPLMALAAKYDVQRVFEDPVFVVANVLLIASPPALTLAQITQAASGDAFERLISRTVFWSYCVMTPPSTILFVVVGLVLAKL